MKQPSLPPLNSRNSHGFTLIELAIVLVIIGLIVSGILVGRDLIHAAEIRATVKQVEEVNTAVMTFRLKYNALPGDMVNATARWGAIDPDPATCVDTPRTGTATCNGSNDGIIQTGSSTLPHEDGVFWQHLQNANLVGQNFRGGPCDDNTPREDMMLRTKLRDTYFTIIGYDASSGYLDAALQSGRNYLALGGGYAEDCLSIGTVISPIDAFSIDNKVDDGKPASGRVSSAINFATTCRDGSSPPNYEVTNTSGTNNCALLIKAAF